MNIEVGNISYTQATISWSSVEPCPENYYHIMYRPNWNSIFSSYLRHTLHHKERVPSTLSSFVLHRLAPSTVYLICVTCKSSYPSSNHCTMFRTLDRAPFALGGSQEDPSISIWVVGALLIASFLALLTFFCFQFCCGRCLQSHRSHGTGPQEEADELTRWSEDALVLGLREEARQELSMTAVLIKNSRATHGSPRGSLSGFFTPEDGDNRATTLPQCGF
ncbi:fibronectin type III domain-containing protein 9 isoform X2 [Ornithorhynchus anatinus]|uniref:Fibronectin type III domain containing 9 n=2 Tax=Ornithorhynchus anatinus TaxID=9258 RepID=A0A6I8PJI8_ORNAN|nr:fibronectin type III domain-containing protein 9 isoform X2 [Ornithorhynchus anatinus]